MARLFLAGQDHKNVDSIHFRTQFSEGWASVLAQSNFHTCGSHLRPPISDYGGNRDRHLKDMATGSNRKNAFELQAFTTLPVSDPLVQGV